MSERVESKTRRNAPIAIDAEGFRRMGHRLVNDVAELLATMPDRPVAPGEMPAEVPSTLLRLYHLLTCPYRHTRGFPGLRNQSQHGRLDALSSGYGDRTTERGLDRGAARLSLAFVPGKPDPFG